MGLSPGLGAEDLYFQNLVREIFEKKFLESQNRLFLPGI